MKKSKLNSLLNEKEIKSAKEIISFQFGNEYDVMREFFFRRGALVFKNKRYQGVNKDSLADIILNDLPENKKSIKQFESTITKAGKQYSKKLAQLKKEKPHASSWEKNKLALESVINKEIHPEINSKARAYEATYLSSLLKTSIILEIWDKTHINPYEVVKFSKYHYDNSKQKTQIGKLNEIVPKVIKKFQHKISNTTLNNNYLNPSFLEEIIELGLEANNGTFDPTVMFENKNNNEWQKVAATVALIMAMGISSTPTNSETSGLQSKEKITIQEVDITEIKQNTIINNYLIYVANQDEWNRREERSTTIMLADSAFNRITNKGLKVDSTDIAFILSKLHQESRYTQLDEQGKILKSHSGAKGAMQLLPSTVNWMNRELRDTSKYGNTYINALPSNPKVAFGTSHESTIQNIEWGIIYWRYLKNKFQDNKLALISYNMGPGKTNTYLNHYKVQTIDGLLQAYERDTVKILINNNGEKHKIKIPLESRNYVKEVFERADEMIQASTNIIKKDYVMTR